MAMSASALKAQQAEADKKLPTIKLMLLGDSGVGKSSIMNRFTDNSFAESARLLHLDIPHPEMNSVFFAWRIHSAFIIEGISV